MIQAGDLVRVLTTYLYCDSKGSEWLKSVPWLRKNDLGLVLSVKEHNSMTTKFIVLSNRKIFIHTAHNENIEFIFELVS